MTRRTLTIALVLALAAPALLAQDTAKPSESTEDAALRSESRGRYEEALDGFRKAFSEAVKEAGAAGSEEERARDLSRAEFYLEKIGWLTGETTRFRETGKFLEGFDGAATGANLKSWIDWYRARALVAEGRVDEARALLGDLGFVTDFWVAGSFDNERGGGYDRAFPPESGPIDLDQKMKGKDREVTWRRAAFSPVFGYFDLDAQFRPNDQCLAYAAAWLKSPKERDAVVRIGSDEAVKVWVNGTLAIARDVSRPCGFDQDAAAVHLRAGANRILVKVGDETGPWGFRLRFTRPDGSALTDLVVTNTREEIAAAETELAEAGAVAAPEIETSRGAIDVLGAADAAGKANARDLFHLGYLQHRRHYDDRHDRVAMKLLERAVKADPENPFLRYALAVAAEREVEAAVDQEENDRRRAMEKAIELDQNYAQAYYLLAHYYTYTLPIYEKAEANVRRALEVNPAFLDARLLQIDLLRRRGYPAEAQAQLTELLRMEKFAGYTPFLLREADDAASRHRTADEEAALKRALDRDWAEDGARRRLIDTMKEAAKPEEALPLYEERLVLDPYDVGTLGKKALLLEGLGRFEDAAETALRALAICPDDDDLLNQVGRLYYKLEDRDQALAYWKRALDLNPKLADLRRYVEFIDPSSRPYEDAFPVDLAALVARARDFESTENDPWVNVFEQQVDKVNPDGTSSSFRRQVVKILNEQGVKRFDRYGAPYSPSDQAIHWKVFTVHHPDGSTEDGRVIQGRFVDLPRLSPGDVIHLEWRVDDLTQSFFGDYFGETFFFGDWVPTLESEYVVIAPEDKELFFHTRNLDLEPVVSTGPEGKTKIFTFHPKSVEKIRWESNMPAAQEVFPQVQVSNYRSWDDFARWYWQLIRNQFQMNDEMKAKVAELVAGKESRYEKIRAIYDFVVTDIRYDSSWEFGVHGYKPYDATAIWSRKFGDCKDKAILTTTLLKEIGIEAYPVLIYGGQRWKEDLSLPLVGHFNHCISWVPDVDGEGRSMFLDGTAQYHSIEAMPGMDRGAKVLVVRPDGGEIMDVPWNRPEDNGVDQDFTATVNPDGSGTVDVKMVFKGDVAVQIRNAFAVEGQRALRLNMLLGRIFGKATLKEFSFSDLTDLSTIDVTLTMTVEVPKLAEKSSRGLELKLGFDQMNLSSLVASAERKWDVVLGTVSSQVATGTYRIPEGFKIVSRPEDASSDHPWGAASLTVEAEDGVVRFARKLVFKAPRVPAGDYDALREFAAAVDLAAREKVVIASE